MGYTAKPTQQFMFIGSPFQMVGGADDMTIGKLQTNCNPTQQSGEGWQPASDAVVMLDPGGSFIRKLVYYPTYATYEMFPAGWYDNNDIYAMDFTKCYNESNIPFGSAIQISASGVNAAITFSGEVKKTETFIPVMGFMGIANCAPKTLKLGHLKTNCNPTQQSGEGWQPASDAVVMLDEGGSFIRKLVYYPTYATYEMFPAGWYDNNDIYAMDFTKCYDNVVTWEPGDGFQVSVSGTNARIQIDPAITEDAE